MKVMYEDTAGHIVWFHDVISVVEYDKFIVLNTSKYFKKIIKYKIESLEIIPC